MALLEPREESSRVQMRKKMILIHVLSAIKNNEKNGVSDVEAELVAALIALTLKVYLTESMLKRIKLN